MRLLAGLVVLAVDLDGLVGLGGDQTRSGIVEDHGEDSGFAVHRARLYGGLEALEVVAGAPVPQVHRSVVTAGHQNTFWVDRHAVDDGVVTGQVLNEVPLRASPLLDVVGAGRCEHVQRRVEDDAADALLVVGERAHALAGGQVPQPHRRVVTAGDDLRIRRLRNDAGDGVCVSDERVDVRLRSHVPNARCRVATGGDEHIQGRVERHAVHRRQVSVIVPNDLVVLEIPALHLPVLAAGEQVRVARRHGEAADGADVTGQRELQLSTCQVPNLNNSISSTCREPLVARLHRHAPHPAQMAADDAVKFPRRVPLGARNRRRFLGKQQLLAAL